MVGFPTSFSQQTGQEESGPAGTCGAEPSGVCCRLLRLWVQWVLSTGRPSLSTAPVLPALTPKASD